MLFSLWINFFFHFYTKILRKHFTLHELKKKIRLKSFVHPVDLHFNYDNSMTLKNLIGAYIFFLSHVQIIPFYWKKISYFSNKFTWNEVKSTSRIEIVVTVWMATPKSVQILRLLNTLFSVTEKIFPIFLYSLY